MTAIWATNPSTLRDNEISASVECFYGRSTCMRRFKLNIVTHKPRVDLKMCS